MGLKVEQTCDLCGRDMSLFHEWRIERPVMVIGGDSIFCSEECLVECVEGIKRPKKWRFWHRYV